VVKVEGRLLTGYSLVEVDIAQVFGWLLRGTHFLVIVDHPSREIGKRTEKDKQIGHINFVSQSKVLRS
jgi:hypothetical protein